MLHEVAGSGLSVTEPRNHKQRGQYRRRKR